MTATFLLFVQMGTIYCTRPEKATTRQRLITAIAIGGLFLFYASLGSMAAGGAYTHIMPHSCEKVLRRRLRELLLGLGGLHEARPKFRAIFQLQKSPPAPAPAPSGTSSLTFNNTTTIPPSSSEAFIYN